MSQAESLPNETREPQRQVVELQSLRRMLDASRGSFSLSVAVCNSPALRDHLMQELPSSVSRIEVVAVPPDTVDVFGAVNAAADDAERLALFVVGLEQSVPSAATQQAALRSLNASRELWQHSFACPVVFWLPDYAATLLTIHAPDFWRYRSHRFEFVSEQAGIPSAMADRFAGNIDAASGLSADEKEFRIAELEQRLAEAGTNPTPNLVPHQLLWLNELAFLYSTRGDLDRAEAIYRNALAIEEKLGRLEGMASEYGNLGNIYQMRGELDQAETMHRKSLAIEEKLGRLEGMAGEYGNLGLIYRMRGDLDQAETMQRKAIAIFEKLGQLAGMASGYGNLGNIYQMRGDLDQAETMQRKAIAIFEKLGQLAGMASEYGNLGLMYETRGDLDQAEAMHRKSLAIFEKLGQLEGIASAYCNLGNVYYARADLDQAEAHWTKARDLFAQIGMPHMVAEVQRSIDTLPPPEPTEQA